MRQKRQKLTSASWLRRVCGGFHNLIRFNCAPFFASRRRHRVLTVTCLDACRCAAYLLSHAKFSLYRLTFSWHLNWTELNWTTLWYSFVLPPFSFSSSIVVYKATLHSNGSYPIVICVFFAAGIFLPTRSLAMGLHVTISNVMCNRGK
jgi:hypothetical protein